MLCVLGALPPGSVFTGMLDFGDPVRSKALKNSVLFLAHRFPNVRKTTAEALYLKLLANEEVVDQVTHFFPKGVSDVLRRLYVPVTYTTF